MTKLTSSEIKGFLLEKRGYIKKSPINVAKAIWKTSKKHVVPKTAVELKGELSMISNIQKSLRLHVPQVITDDISSAVQIYDQILRDKNKPKRKLFFDLEVSPNIVFSWRIGGDIHLTHDDIIHERAIICACWKWEGDPKVYALEWKNGDDKDLLRKFSAVIDSADEIITQNGDSFDIKWLRTRCLYHGIPVPAKFNSIDTLKMARSGFKFNSNKLDYMGQFLDLGKKIKTDYDLWKNITLHNDKECMKKMVEYCKEDVALLERVYQKLQKYCLPKKFKYSKN